MPLQKIRMCACQFYRRLDRQILAAVQSAARAAGVECEVVPDLCFLAAKQGDRIDDIASADAVLACQPRAVRALLGNPDTLNCFDVRKTPLDDLLAALSLPADEQPSQLVYEEQHSDWVPWFPVIDANRCIQCKKCVDFCMFGVYAVESEKVRVIRPDACKTDCPACARICPQNAIIFPKSEEEIVNGSLDEPVKPTAGSKQALAERLRNRNRKSLRLFKEDVS